MMLSIRRAACWSALSAVVVIVLIQTKILGLPYQVPLFREVLKPDQRVASVESESFWANLPIHFPVTHYEPLPRAEAHRLPRVQHQASRPLSEVLRQRNERQADVKLVFQRCWTAYHERAWMQDELAPISGGAKSTFGGWAATLVDTLDTLWIMDLKTEFLDAVNATLSIDFADVTFEEINVFETTIRYLGGLLAAYDLSGDSRLLDKTLELADMLYVAFDTPNRMPILRWKVQLAAKGATQIADEGALVAEIGSLTLEFTRLSQITNDPKWYDAVYRIMAVFENQQNMSNVPGMWPLGVNPRHQDFASGTVFTLGAMSDSLYEYLPKMYALLGGSASYDKLYRGAMAASIEYSLFRPMLPDNADVLVAGMVHANSPGNIELEPQGQHLVCFAGGMLALGGRLIQDETHVEIGRKLTDGCIWAYEHSELGIMPEVYFMLPCDETACVWDESKWHSAVLKAAGDEHTDALAVIESRRLPPGFTSINDRRYILRPEAIESVFVLYRITGDAELQEKAWMMWESIKKHTETGIANAAVSDVTDSSAPKSDSMESFWTAETLKYFYLIFSDPDLISLDDYVFNTEAHAFKRPSNQWWR